MAKKSNRRGRTAANKRSTYLVTFKYISASVVGASRSSGWLHGWIKPFMSTYKLSYSTPLGLASSKSNGTVTPPTTAHRFSNTSVTILGYFSDNQR